MTHSSPTIGIVGGFGPDISAAFCKRLVEHAHTMQPLKPPHFVVDFVSVPSSTSKKAIEGSRHAGKKLVFHINKSIERLESLGVQAVALPCNTLHLFSNSFTVRATLGLVHIVQSVTSELKSSGATHVGLLATGLTVTSDLYHKELGQHSIQCNTPTLEQQHRLNNEIQLFVQTGSVSAHCSDIFEEIFDNMLKSNVDAIILGCTDLSGMLEKTNIHAPHHCIDSMDVLAKKCAEMCSK